MRPNVILIVLDTARADALEPYGAPPGSTPAIADLARRGVAHRQVQATASWTLPSHASMFTGLLPRATGIVDRPDATPHSARAALETQRDRMLPAVLRANGYATGAVSTNLWITEDSGFGLGFDEFVTVASARQAHLHRDDLRSRLSWDREALRARADDGAAEAGATLRRWLGDGPGRPFFWFVNLVECHSPYLPPRPWNDLGPLARVRAAEDARRYLTMAAIWKACAGGFDVPDHALARMRHLYARSVRLMDDWLADLLGELDRAGALDETLVILTSDHGENFGEGGLMGHAFSLDQRLTHVPLVAAGPGAPGDDGVLSLARLPGLIAVAAGIEAHPWRNSVPPDGVAVAQFDPPAPADDARWQASFAEWGLDPDEAGPRIGSALTSATDGHRKLLVRAGSELVLDLERDPLELAPRAPTATDEPGLAPLRAALAHPGAAAVSAVEPVAPAAIDDERAALEDRMRLLGYM